jgi:hypothetical protein
MLIIDNLSALKSLKLPLPDEHTVKHILTTQIEIDSPESYTIVIEADDHLAELDKQVGRNIENSLEGSFILENYFVGVVLFGNSGAGVNILCPDRDGYADAIRLVLKKHLTSERRPL